MSHVCRTLSTDDSHSSEELLPLIYHELRRLAAAKMAGQLAGQTIQATALVHEAWLKLSKADEHRWNDRAHFFASAAEAMRQILIDRARRRLTQKHGGRIEKISIDESESIQFPADTPGNEDTLLEVNEALDNLAKTDPDRAQVVKLKFFVGLQNGEIAELLQVSTKTVQRHWIAARAWLFQQFDRDTTPPS